MIALATSLALAVIAGGVFALNAKNASDERAEAEAAEKAKVAADFEQCQEETADYLDALQSVSGLVDAGVTQSNDGQAVGAAAGEGRRVGDVSEDCQTLVVDN